MPAPRVPRSSSDPTLSDTHHRSACSSQSNKSSWTKKVGKLIGKENEWSNHSDLTEESLKEHNRRHSHLDEKNYKCSPYYKGLTDASLTINRQRVSAVSPGRESHATTAVTSTSSLSSFIAKMQEWSFFFTFKTSHDKGDRKYGKKSKKTEFERKEIINDSKSVKETKGKPLRESIAERTPPPPTTTLSSNILSVACEEDANGEVSENKFCWAAKYQPKVLKDFICNRDKANQLQELMKAGACGHFIFEGPKGVGKRTMISAMLREAHGPDSIQAREERKAFELRGEAIRSIQINVKESCVHVEVNLSKMKGYEKHVVVELIKETQGQISNKSSQTDIVNSRAIILYEADTLSTDALLYIRWVLERYKGCNKVFFCCSDVLKLHPIKSLCTLVQLLPPSNREIVEVLEYIAKQEGIELPHKMAEKIAENSKNNLRQAIRSFEASWKIGYPFKEDEEIMTGWEDDIANIAKNIVEEQSPKQLYIIRGKLQNLTEHGVSPEFIFKSLVAELKKQMNKELHSQIDSLFEAYNLEDGNLFDSETPLFGRNQNDEPANRLNDRIKMNLHQFMRIEEFIAKVMSWYKKQSRITKSST